MWQTIYLYRIISTTFKCYVSWIQLVVLFPFQLCYLFKTWLTKIVSEFLHQICFICFLPLLSLCANPDREQLIVYMQKDTNHFTRWFTLNLCWNVLYKWMPINKPWLCWCGTFSIWCICWWHFHTRHDKTRHDEKRAKVFDCIQKLPNFFFSFEQVEANRNKLRWNIKIEWKIVHSYSTVMPSRISKLKYILDWNSISFLIGRSCVECFEANTKVVCTNITNAT